MPWEIKMKNGKHCVYKKGSDTALKCYASHEEALKYQKALYANEAMSQAVFTSHAFSEAERKKIKAGEPVWVHATTFGDWDHPLYGEQTFDDFRFERMLSNYESGVYGQDLPINYEHFGQDASKGFKAAGWVQDVEIRENGLWYKVTFTEQAAEEINDDAWRYFSFEWYDYWEDEKGTPFLDVLAGGALTNSPFRRGMVPLNAHSMAALEVMPESEHADLEHSEPGTGSPPERRTDGDIPDEDLYRREQVPPAFEEPEDKQNGGIDMEEFLKKLREKLGLSENAKEDEILTVIAGAHGFSASIAEKLGLSKDVKPEDVLKAVDEVNAELEPLRDADKTAKERRAFREQFPDEFKQMEELRETDRDNKAKAFSGIYSRFAVMKDGKPTDEKQPRGFSALVLTDIENAHRDISKGTFSATALQDLLDHIANNGIVDLSERGSSRLREGERTEEVAPRQAFSTLVKEIMEEDNLERDVAIREAAKRDPELYEQYRNPHVSA